MSDQIKSQRRRWPLAEKLRIVQECFRPGISVAAVARANGVNSNQVFRWVKLHQNGQLKARSRSNALVPVRIVEEPAMPSRPIPHSVAGAIHVELPNARLRVEGGIDQLALRTILECLRT